MEITVLRGNYRSPGKSGENCREFPKQGRISGYAEGMIGWRIVFGHKDSTRLSSEGRAENVV